MTDKLAELPQFRPLASRPSEQAGKEDSAGDHGGAGGGDEDGYDMTGCSGPTTHRDVRNFLACHKSRLGETAFGTLLKYIARFEETETQLAEAKAELEIAWEDDPQVPELKAKLEAAEAERAHLLGRIAGFQGQHALCFGERMALKAAEDTLREYFVNWSRGECDDSSMCSALAEFLDRDQSRASAATEEPKPQPHPQGARLGGPADKLRADIVEALRKHGVENDEHSWDECLGAIATDLERLGKNP